MEISKFSQYTQTAYKAAKAGAEVLMKYYGKKLNIEMKGEIDPVSQADKNSQKKIISIIKENFPTHGILAEEDGVNELNNEFCWIIDPLDGTINFIHSVPQFCVSIGLKYKDEIICGVIYCPAINEVFIAQKGKGAYLNGRRISVCKQKKLIASLSATGFPYYIKQNGNRVIKNFKKIVKECQGMRRFGSAAIDMAYVACGRFDFYWEEGLKPWDIAAGIIIAKEAGAVITDYIGTNQYTQKAMILVSNSKSTHKQVLKLLDEK